MTHKPLRLAAGAMGTRFELVLLDGRGDLRAAGEAALEQIEMWHRRLTRFAADSLVSHINREAAKGPVSLDRDTFELLHDAMTVWRESEGAFDITIAPAMTRSGYLDSAVPARDGHVDAGALLLEPDNWTIEFTAPGISIDLGGIGKGHALDCAARVLRDAGVTSALLHAGTSSIAAVGAPGRSDGWPVEIPSGRTGRTIALRDAAISVSDPGGPVDARRGGSHILDPRDASPVTPSVRATVMGPSARLADAWSTALVVRGSTPAAFPSHFSAFIDVYDPAAV
jgi:thiamine biosynthesis lipoprotein